MITGSDPYLASFPATPWVAPSVCPLPSTLLFSEQALSFSTFVLAPAFFSILNALSLFLCSLRTSRCNLCSEFFFEQFLSTERRASWTPLWCVLLVALPEFFYLSHFWLTADIGGQGCIYFMFATPELAQNQTHSRCSFNIF